MTPKEAYEYKRHNFIQNALKYFDFLILEYGYTKAEQLTLEQENDVVIADTFRFENEEKANLIIISNNYHPYDYGFSINICDSGNFEDCEMVYYKLKEDQDLEQSYIEEAARFLKDYLKKAKL